MIRRESSTWPWSALRLLGLALLTPSFERPIVDGNYIHFPTSDRVQTRLTIGKLTTHVLDTAHGCPAAGMNVTLTRLEPETDVLTIALDSDGRAPAPLLAGSTLTKGRYRLVFDVADYFRSRGVTLPDPPFLDRVPVEFAVADVDANYHVPLLVSPWSYSTYRGS